MGGNLESTEVRNVSGRRTRSSRAVPTFTAEELELVEKAARNKRRIEKMILEQTRILEQKNEKDKSVDVFESISIKNSNPSRPVAAWMGQNPGDPDPGGDPDRNDDFDNWNPPFWNRRGGGGGHHHHQTQMTKGMMGGRVAPYLMTMTRTV